MSLFSFTPYTLYLFCYISKVVICSFSFHSMETANKSKHPRFSWKNMTCTKNKPEDHPTTAKVLTRTSKATKGNSVPLYEYVCMSISKDKPQ